MVAVWCIDGVRLIDHDRTVVIHIDRSVHRPTDKLLLAGSTLADGKVSIELSLLDDSILVRIFKRMLDAVVKNNRNQLLVVILFAYLLLGLQLPRDLDLLRERDRLIECLAENG